MIDDTSINVYLPTKGTKLTNKKDTKKIFISKDNNNGPVEYWCFDLDSLELEQIDNIIRYLITNNIHSLDKVTPRRKIAFLTQIGKAIESSKKADTLNEYKLLLMKKDSERIVL